MKLLHTSDWHLGHLLYNYDRSEEQRAMLQQMVEIVKDEQPDVFLLCGDVYHTSQPSSAVQTMFAEALVAIHQANPGMTMVVTAGNHDSGAKHEIFRKPWRALQVFAIGNLNKECLDEHVIEVPGKGFVVAVPYVNERNLPDDCFQGLLDRVADRNAAGLPVVLMAHTTVQGCDFAGHEQATDRNVGGIDALPVERFGQGYDYLALGHIHHEQFVHTGKHNVRYSGSPLAVSFDECYSHSVSVVELAGQGARPVVRQVEIVNPRPLVTLPTEDWTSWDEAQRLLKDFPADIPAYIRLNVKVDDFLPADANAVAQRLTKDKQCRFCLINAHRKEKGQREERGLTVQEFQQEDPLAIAQRYANDTGVPFDAEMTELFNETLQLIADDDRNV